MKVLMINGSPHERGCTYTALKEVADTLQKQAIATSFYWIGKGPVQGCVACGGCKKGCGCVFKDDANLLGNLISEADGIVIGSPVYYAGANGALTALLDRVFYSHSSSFVGKPGACVVSCRRGGASAAFDRLNKYFSICNMPIVPSQYWNQVHGSKPEDILQDEEGLQTMRTLGLNMAWLLRCIKNGTMADNPQPIYEPKVRTNFIR